MAESLEVFVTLGMNEPKQLKSIDGTEFYLYISPPLPKFIVIFTLNKHLLSKDSDYEITVLFDDTVDEKEIGKLSHLTPCLCWNETWSKEEIQCADKILKKNRLIKLVVSKVDQCGVKSFNTKEQTRDVDSKLDSMELLLEDADDEIKEFEKSLTELEEETSKKHRTKKSTTKQDKKIKETTTEKGSSNIKSFFSKANKTPTQTTTTRRKGQQLKQESEKENIDKNKSELDIFNLSFDEDENDKKTNDSNAKPFTKVATKRNSSSLKSSNVKKRKGSNDKKKIEAIKQPGIDEFEDDDETDVPSERWGHTFCSIDDNKVVLLGGQGKGKVMNPDSLWIFDKVSKTWTFENTDQISVERRMGHTVTYDATSKVLYVFGGSKHKKWYNTMHTLDLHTWKWNQLETTGKAPTRAYHSCNNHYEELLIFGGVFPNPDPTPDGCSNQVVIFDKEKNSWYEPIVTGEIPAARSGHSAVIVGGKLYIFGGWDAPNCFNDTFALDLCIMKFSQVNCTGKVPTPRTWHSTTVLCDETKFCIYGGFDGDNAKNELFMFNTVRSSWTAIECGAQLERTGHTAILWKRDDDDAENDADDIIVFGGGNNNGKFYNDVITVNI